MIDEGYTKYRCDWRKTAASSDGQLDALNACRNRLYREGLVGYYAEHGVGFGNLSVRIPGTSRFLISGTQTGHIAHTGPEHYAVVTDYDIDANRVVCEGPVQASSEALTHAAIYELDPGIGGIAHVHSAELWARLIDRIPTTSAHVPYGTPEMAHEFERLYRQTGLADTGVAVMAGHDEGIVGFGSSIEEATGRVLALIERSAPVVHPGGKR
jgi:ribulose-5-phosphate 4-epimerase/fuculose-1-phosphate aldolase